MADKPGHVVTITDLYNQGNETKEELETIKTTLATLLERHVNDKEKLEELDKSNKWLVRTVYAIGIPVVVLLGGLEAVTRIWM